ncbi:uncharacterized protein LOC117151016 [Drosophila mauritiana]|uniref:Uncharacterized protein LOC117151016 n=1 Tax=Drosophila mauritiana TaxID=7226 RepID=A0A6P8KY64_DROMA|nr:uncharacterized protein LOC117151016 [Drosophila mauritiana]
MEGGKAILHSSDLTFEYIYDDEKHVSYMPDSKLSVGLLDPETCIKCPRCHKSILSTKVLKS